MYFSFFLGATTEFSVCWTTNCWCHFYLETEILQTCLSIWWEWHSDGIYLSEIVSCPKNEYNQHSIVQSLSPTGRKAVQVCGFLTGIIEIIFWCFQSAEMQTTLASRAALGLPTADSSHCKVSIAQGSEAFLQILLFFNSFYQGGRVQA